MRQLNSIILCLEETNFSLRPYLRSSRLVIVSDGVVKEESIGLELGILNKEKNRTLKIP
jgi:hypothetical protein